MHCTKSYSRFGKKTYIIFHILHFFVRMTGKFVVRKKLLENMKAIFCSVRLEFCNANLIVIYIYSPKHTYWQHVPGTLR